MTLPSGTRLGPYEILAPLGAGGMGEVYRARDTKLGREVAIKVLPARLAGDVDALARFEREAKAVAALSHPNILSIFDFGLEGGTAYAVMELLEGETLRERLSGGAVPARKAIDYAVQVARGLAAAHEKGVIHRDLKPENLFVTSDGRVKILDFGLARVSAPQADETQSPTAVAATEPGTVMGTVGYMSPEQVRGQRVDHRSDIFSFGSVLYEMLTGRRAFRGESAAETMAAIAQRDPPELSVAGEPLSPSLDRIVRHCLEKSPAERFQSARDLAFGLQSVTTASSSSGIAPVGIPPSSSSRRRVLFGIIGTLGLVLAWALGRWTPRKGEPDRAARPVRFAIPIPPGATYAPAEISRGISISPDGTRLVIEAFSRGRRRLFLRPLDSERTIELEGTAGATAHFWSPDSRFLAFFADGKLKKVPAAGGPPQDLCDALFEFVGTWNREGTILFAQLPPAAPGIYRISDKGGEAVRIMAPDPSREIAVMWPQFLPDGRRFLYSVLNFGPEVARRSRELRVTSLDSRESRTVAHLDSRFEYGAPGYLLHVRDAALFAQPFDEKKARLSGEPILLAERVRYFNGPANASFSVSQNGVLAFETAEPPVRLVWFDRHGKEIGQLGEPSVVDGLRISPDGARAAVDVGDRRTGTSDVWVFELTRGVSTRLHSDAIDERMPLWSPDGSKLVFRSDQKGPPDIHEMAVGLPGSERPLLEQEGVQQPEDISRDGRFLTYLNEPHATADIWLLPLQGERKPAPWLRTRFDERSPRFSPDGRWIAYESDESGEAEIYVALTEGGGEKRRLSPEGGRRPRWRRDGKELYYIAPGGFVMALPVAPGSQLEAGAPVPLFHVEPDIEDYDVVPDGSRFLVSTPLEKVRESPIRVIVNWTAALDTKR